MPNNNYGLNSNAKGANIPKVREQHVPNSEETACHAQDSEAGQQQKKRQRNNTQGARENSSVGSYYSA